MFSHLRRLAPRTVLTLALVFPAAASAQSRGIGAILNQTMQDTACAAGFCVGNKEPRGFVEILGAYTNGIITLLGLIFMVLIIWGGFKWMTAAGNEDQVTKAKGVVKNAAIGLGIVLLARVITSLILNIIEPAVTGGP